MRALYIISLFINCCYSFISNPPTPHNSNAKTPKCIITTNLIKRPIFSRITSSYLKKNNSDDETNKIMQQLIILVLYNWLLFYSIYYIFFDNSHPASSISYDSNLIPYIPLLF